MEKLWSLGFCHNIPIKIYTLPLGSARMRWVLYSRAGQQCSVCELVDTKEGIYKREGVKKFNIALMHAILKKLN